MTSPLITLFFPVLTMNSSPEPTSPARYAAGNEHDDYSYDDWKTAVIKNETDLGYHEWATSNGEMDEMDQADFELDTLHNLEAVAVRGWVENKDDRRASQLRQELSTLNTASAVAARGWMV